MAKKEGSKKYVLVLLLVLVLALAIGYATFTDVLRISGTATVKSDAAFDLRFTSASATVTSEGCTASVSLGQDSGEADDLLSVSVTDLAYPGAGAQIKAVIKNFGTMAAKLKTITPTGITGNTNAIKIIGLDQYVANEVIQPGATCEVVFTVQWDPNVNTINSSLAGENGSNFSFGLTLEYEQSTTPVTVTNTHTDTAAANP